MTPAINKPLPEFEAVATGGLKIGPDTFHGQAVVQFRDRFENRRRMGEFGEDDEPDIAERGVTEHGPVDGREHPVHPHGDLVPRRRIGLIGLAGGGEVSERNGHFTRGVNSMNDPE